MIFKTVQSLARGVAGIGLLWILYAAEPRAKAESAMEITACDNHYLDESSLPRLALLREAGFTSMQTYIYWKDIETSPGTYDWSKYDKTVETLERAGLKWVPFLIAGPWYVTPEHARNRSGVTFARCVEHHRDSRIPSIWCPAFKQAIEEYVQAFAAHYGKRKSIESINLGITGDYGESIFQVIGNWPGEYHTHPGMWCDDPIAINDFKKYMSERYAGDLAELNGQWRTCHQSFDDIRPFARQNAPSDEAWLAEIEWYRKSMTDYADWWMGMARRHFGSTPLYLCTGGDMPPEQGSDFSAQVKAAAKHDCGIRITNEASSFPHNFLLTRLVSSASRFYGTFYGNEPASAVTAEGSLGRLFNARVGGARQLFVYTGNVLDGNTPMEGWNLLKMHRAQMEISNPSVPIAYLFPTQTQVVKGFSADLPIALRRMIDYDLIDERMVLDGILREKQILFVANVARLGAGVAEKIRDWVEAGGNLIVLNARVTSSAGTNATWDALVGFGPEAEEINGHAPAKLHDRAFLVSYENPAQWTLRQAWLGLSRECHVYFGMDTRLGGAVIWSRDEGKGRVYAYHGPIQMTQDPQEWNQVPPLAMMFINDLLAFLKGDETTPRMGKTPPWGQNSIFLSKMQDGSLLGLNMGDTTATLDRQDGVRVVPPRSITRIN